LNRLLADARRRKFDSVLVYRYDRFARILRQLVNALSKFDALGIHFVSLTKLVWLRRDFPSRFTDVLFDDSSRVLVIAEADKLRVPQPICFGPFQELDLCNCLGSQPDAFLHLFGSQAFAPAGLVLVGQIDESHLGLNQTTDFLEYRPAKAGTKPLRTRAT
jgi:hypothetical protein